MMTPREYADLHARLSSELERIARLFKRDVRLSLVVRQPGNPDGTTYLSDDNTDEVIAAINDVRARPAYAAGPAEPARAEASPSTSDGWGGER